MHQDPRGGDRYALAPIRGAQMPASPMQYGYGYGYGQPGQDPFQTQEPTFDFFQILAIAVRWRWLIVTLTALCLSLGLLITLLLPPKYLASAKIEVSAQSAKVLQDLEIVSNSADLSRAQSTAIQRLGSRSLFERVVFELDLTKDEKLLFPSNPLSINALVSTVLGKSDRAVLDNMSAPQRERIAVGAIARGVVLTPVRGTNIVEVGFSSGDPQRSAKIANQIVASYVDQRIDKGSETSDTVREFITDQVSQVKGRLQKSEEELLVYAKKANITITQDETSLISNNIQQINESLAKVIQERLQYDRRAEQIRAGKAASLPSVVENEALSNLQSKITTLRAEYREKLATFKPNFPLMKSLRAQIGELQNQEKRLVNAIAESVIVKHQGVISNEKDLRAKLEELEAEQREYQDKTVQYTILKREVDSNRKQYEALIGKLNEVGVGAELRTSNAEIIESAIPIHSPYSPNMLINLAAALMMAFALSGASIYVLELLDNSISSPDQVESILKLALLGIVPRVEEKALREALETVGSSLSEAYRSLRTSLQFVGSNGVPETLLVTSAEAGEGKSTTAQKTAIEFGSLGTKVLLIDCDMRKPNLQRLFGCDNIIGLSNILTGTLRQEDMANVFRKTEYENVTLLTSGKIPPNPADLLLSQRMDMLAKAVQERFDLVIFDGPPVIGLSDAPILSHLAQGTLLVVSFNQVSRKSCLNAIKRLRASGGNILGAVITKFDSGSLNIDSSYKYMAYNYYEYGDDKSVITAREGIENEQVVADPSSFGSSLRRFARRIFGGSNGSA